MSHSLWFILIWGDPSLGGAWLLTPGCSSRRKMCGRSALEAGGGRGERRRRRRPGSVNKTGYAKQEATRHHPAPLGGSDPSNSSSAQLPSSKGQRQKGGSNSETLAGRGCCWGQKQNKWAGSSESLSLAALQSRVSFSWGGLMERPSCSLFLQDLWPEDAKSDHILHKLKKEGNPSPKT